ncbi:hypothetical protein MMC22_006806 [Lobaria immixta]|nr:hypothetical protein [Lobaria immixta]
MSTTNTISTKPSDAQLDNVASSKTPYLNISPQSTSPSPSQHVRPRVQAHESKSSIRVEDYYARPRDIQKHSKLPYFLRLYGSITPRMLVPLAFVGCWATIITCVSEFKYELKVSNLLLTVLGFVVGLGISFRTSSAYERYVEGRKYWAQLIQTSRDLARHIWIHTEERHDQDPQQGKAELLAKLTALNLIVAFAVSLKHRLRFEPYTNYDDLEPLVSHLSTFAGAASEPPPPLPRKASIWKEAGGFLGLTFAESNPRKVIKRSTKNLGNLPLEILTYLSAYVGSIAANGTLNSGVLQGLVMSNLASLNEVLAGTERVLNTPLPVAYSIAISQITWVYVIALPFQLWESLRWITIPGTVVGAYIILGIAAIGREIENPFGLDPNDLPLKSFCTELAAEIDEIASKAPPKPEDFIRTDQNRVLYSLGYGAWNERSVEDIRATLRAKADKPPVANEQAGLAEKVMQHVV